MIYYTVVTVMECYTAEQTETIGMSTDIQVATELFNSAPRDTDEIRLMEWTTDVRGRVTSSKIVTKVTVEQNA